MSFQFDWTALTPFLSGKLKQILESVPSSVNPMLDSKIKVRSISLGTEPPHISFSRIISLHQNEQVVELVFRYKGNAEFDLQFDLNLNIFNAVNDLITAARFMGCIYTNEPMHTKCRFIASSFEITMKVEVTHGSSSFLKFSEEPLLEFVIDSNLSLLGPIFNGGLQKLMRTIRKIYRKVYQETGQINIDSLVNP